MKNLTDAEIWALFKSGKQVKSIEIAYTQTVKSTFAFIFSRIGNRVETEDLTSEVYRIFVEVFPNYNEKSSIQSFIIGIAINKIRQYWQNKKHNNVELDEEILYEDSIFSDEEFDIDEVENSVNLEFQDAQNVRLESVLSKLSPKYCNVLRYTYIQQLKDDEIGKLLQISAGNVRVLRHRALAKAVKIANNITES